MSKTGEAVGTPEVNTQEAATPAVQHKMTTAEIIARARERMKPTKRDNDFGEIFKFEAEGDIIYGKLIKVREIKTKFNTAENPTTQILDINSIEPDGIVPRSVFASTYLSGYDWRKYIGFNIIIEYLGLELNPSSGMKYKIFNVISDGERAVSSSDSF